MALQCRIDSDWREFFVEAGIPEPDCTQYATTFVKNRITEKSMQTLTDAHLNGLEIHVLGDRLAILALAQTHSTEKTHSVVASDVTFRPASASVRLPTVVSNMTHPQFRKFIIDWGVYKNITNLPPMQVQNLLYSCCEESVQNSIISSYPAFFSMDEDAILEAIESLVTVRINPAVHRMNFGNLTQAENEPLKDFLVRMRLLAVDCEFTCPKCHFDISPINIKDQFIRGINNPTLQTDILAKAGQLNTIEDVVKHAEAFETALRDQSQLRQSSDVNAIRLSSYRKNKQRPNLQQRKSCSGCGSTAHGVLGCPPRHSHCPAWGKICSACRKPNHTSDVCRINKATASQFSESNSLIAHVQLDIHTDLYTALCHSRDKSIGSA